METFFKKNANFFPEQICLQFNYAFSPSKFPASFKFADITPVFGNRSRNQEDYYRPTNILPIVAKVFTKSI